MRPRQPGREDKFEKSLLQPGAREGRGGIERDCLAQPLVAVVPDGASKQLFDSAQVEELQLFGPLHHPLQPIEAHRRCEVEKGAG
jgi:hypothetical protein